MSISKKITNLAVGYAATEATNFLMKEFQAAGGVQAMVGKAVSLKDYSIERGSNIVEAVKAGDKQSLADEMQDVAVDSVTAASGAARFVQRGATEIYDKHANGVKSAKRKVSQYIKSHRS